MALELLLTLFHKQEIFFRFENDEDGFYLSIIDRKRFPRVWMDNDKDNKPEYIAESVDHLINKTIWQLYRSWDNPLQKRTPNENKRGEV